ncbi:PQQ-dependent sugar dehydrogenase [Sphingomonas rubra]|uniref:Glucose/arabinose dehydrogenase, beta-propeller fold n=1 Tax=Sphingomonas rubra TaxID=634430 RepID=A0A1I5UC48_9SPHN|nr:PQQ-dependent sugar dehydrogenase [Sphingomonas rubra]SFP92825.1 Glucose/arabinose dehydrogenase, beta-propeller fold [Sphingomonas rubra]
MSRAVSRGARTRMTGRAILRAGIAALALAVVACGGGDDDDGVVTVPGPTPSATPTPAPTPTATPSPTATTTAVTRTPVATFDNPWAMAFLPDGRLLVTERPGRLRLVTINGQVSAAIAGVPAVAYGGQGGLFDVALDPAFATNARIYLSYAEASSGGPALAVARGTLANDGAGSVRLDNVSVIWRATPRSTDTRHFGARMAFARDGTLFVTSGERHQGAPAQDLSGTLGKIIRINTDGTIPADNPFVGTAGVRSEIWSYGHRNPYGLVFASDGRLFESEMGPEGGDEFNLIAAGGNYGWRLVSEGNDGEVLPRHSTRPDLVAPLFSWTPVIAPGGMIQYRGSRFANWNDDFLLAGLVSQGLVRVRVSGTTATEVARIPLHARIREVEQGPADTLWVLEDGGTGRLVRLDPA